MHMYVQLAHTQVHVCTAHTSVHSRTYPHIPHSIEGQCEDVSITGMSPVPQSAAPQEVCWMESYKDLGGHRLAATFSSPLTP
jgi:hypothetical protein